MSLPFVCPIAGYGWLWLKPCGHYSAAREMVSRHMKPGDSGCPPDAVKEFEQEMLPVLLGDPYYLEQMQKRIIDLQDQANQIQERIRLHLGSLQEEKAVLDAERERIQGLLGVHQ